MELLEEIFTALSHIMSAYSDHSLQTPKETSTVVHMTCALYRGIQSFIKNPPFCFMKKYTVYGLYTVVWICDHGIFFFGFCSCNWTYSNLPKVGQDPAIGLACELGALTRRLKATASSICH